MPGRWPKAWFLKFVMTQARGDFSYSSLIWMALLASGKALKCLVRTGFESHFQNAGSLQEKRTFCDTFIKLHSLRPQKQQQKPFASLAFVQLLWNPS